MWRCVVLVLTDVSEECIPSIFRVENLQVGFRLVAVYSHLATVVIPSLIFISLLATCFHAGVLLGLYIDPEDGGDVPP
jgi:hypothetical protein